MDMERRRIADTAARLKRLYTAAVYDIMDEMGLRHQCLDLAIKPIERTMRSPGRPSPSPAWPTRAATRSIDDFPEVRDLTFFRRMYRGCVVVIAAAGETRSGHWGELMSTAAKARGAAGVIIDGGCRDGNSSWICPTGRSSPATSRRSNRSCATGSGRSKSRSR